MIKSKNQIQIVETPIIDGYDFQENNGIINPAFLDTHNEPTVQNTNRDKLHLDIDYTKDPNFQPTDQTFHHYSSPELPEIQPLSNGQSLASSWVYEFNNGSSTPQITTNTMANSTAPLSVMYRSPYGAGYSEQPMHLSYDMDLSHEHSKKSKDKACCQFCPSLVKLFVWTVIIVSLMGIAISIAFIIYIEKFATDDCCGPNNKTVDHLSGNQSLSDINSLLDINKTDTTTAITGISSTEVLKTFRTGFNPSLFTSPLTTPSETQSKTLTTNSSTTPSTTPSSSQSPTLSPTLTTTSSIETTVTDKPTVTYSSHGVTESINTSPIKVNLTQKPNKTTTKYIPTTIATVKEQTITTTSSSKIETTPIRTTDSETTTLTSLEGRALNISNQLSITTTTTTTTTTETESTDQSTNNSTETTTSSSLSSDQELTTLAKAIVVKDSEDPKYDSVTEVIKSIKSNTEQSVSNIKVNKTIGTGI